MVPHETIEEKIAGALQLGSQNDRCLAIVGVPDEVKGEALVLLSAMQIDLPKLRAQLKDAGVPNLWIPKTIRPVDAIPVLASGKLDLKRCQELAATPV
jgi:acyl-[acyl-carrier-protein]-phospholipid O-acyltransferase/long-chain-fatty-acid--[acyl-carrier-protein] ligase